jgi:pSer/pThr/pTyr-binding forkhead associated (FHA) protein
MSDQLLTALKFALLALLYLFFLRVLRAVWAELREPRPAAVVPPAGLAARAAPAPTVIQGLGQPKGRSFDLGDELTVGRGGGCGVALPDDTFVSQLHARIFRRDGAYFVEDLGSTNGTFLNRRKVSAPEPLNKGDRLQVGRTVMEMRP